MRLSLIDTNKPVHKLTGTIMEFKTRTNPELRKFIKLCQKAGIVIWVRHTRFGHIVSLDSIKDKSKAIELALIAGMSF